ncbi:MAG: GNAT family N-acetyltransferase [Ilumatobacter sp.]|nr:GNAT family N-acetyltransferase [Ilumatobacter sp.]
MTMVPVDAGDTTARARLGTWPHEPDIAQIVLLDHHMIPTAGHVQRWVELAQRSDPRSIRTGALFPPAAAAFVDAGFEVIDTLALLEITLDDRSARRRPLASTQRMRTSHLPEIVALDRDAFGDGWSNDERALRDITAATPRHRSRVVLRDGHIAGFAISGQSAGSGYLQRLAVRPDARRRGTASALVDDALRWMRRRGAGRALVNTAADNEAAIALYRRLGFVLRPESLAILELAAR